MVARLERSVQYLEKEMEILIFISDFGVTYTRVIGKTFFKSEQSARNFLSKMVKKKMIRYKITGLAKPKYSILLTERTKRDLLKIGFAPKKPRMSIRVLSHNINEQIAYYWLGRIGKIERKSVWHHKNVFHAVPDLLLRTDRMIIHIEIEMHVKAKSVYKSFVLKSAKDKPNVVVYISENKRMMQTLARAMPIWDKLFYIDIDTLVNNIKEHKKIRPTKQIELLSKKVQDKLALEEKYKKYLP